jgi:hypothetical protein
MKIFLLSIVAVVLVSLSFTSCKKDFTCECKFTDTTRNFSIDIKSKLKNDAKVICADYSDAVGTCVIK